MVASTACPVLAATKNPNAIAKDAIIALTSLQALMRHQNQRKQVDQPGSRADREQRVKASFALVSAKVKSTPRTISSAVTIRPVKTSSR